MFNVLEFSVQNTTSLKESSMSLFIVCIRVSKVYFSRERSLDFTMVI